MTHTPHHHMSRTQHPARIAWLVPSLIEGSGGHRTILQNIEALIDRGHLCTLYVEHNGATSGPEAEAALARVRGQLREFFGFEDAPIRLGFTIDEPCDMVVATAWYTAHAAAQASAPHKVYFVQDYEAWFMPMGDGYIYAENSYRLGLTPITIGRWLTSRLASQFGCRGTYFDFCAASDVYGRDEGVTRDRAVCVIVQPEKPRRCPRTAIEAMGIVKHFMPDVTIHMYGSKDRPAVWYDHQWHGLLDVRGCNALYNRCQVGLCISASNPSRIPYEMMAAGLPVVDIHRENNLFDIPEDAALLADARPEDLAQAVMDLLRDDARRGAMSRAGLAFMRERPLERGFEQFVRAVEAVLAKREHEFAGVHAHLAPLYGRPAIVADIHAPRAPQPTPADIRAAERRVHEAEQKLAAQRELESILDSKAWKAAVRLKESGVYRAVASARFGDGWDHIDPNEDPRVRLARVKNSRTYRLISKSKSTGLYRWYVKGNGAGPGHAGGNGHGRHTHTNGTA
jgi:hypothetical protein